MPNGLPIPPTMQAIIVDCVPTVDPQLAPIIRNNAETVLACPPDAQNTCPTHSKVITSSKTPPFAVRVAIIDNLGLGGYLGLVINPHKFKLSARDKDFTISLSVVIDDLIQLPDLDPRRGSQSKRITSS